MKTSSAAAAKVKKGFFLLLSVIFWGIFLYVSFQSTASSLLTKKLMTQKLPLQEARNTGITLSKIHPHGIEQLYAAMGYFCNIRRDPQTALMLIETLQQGTTPEYGNIENLKGDVALHLGKMDTAVKAYWKEAENYPLAVIPVYKLLQIAKIRGDHALANQLQENLDARKKAKSINEKMFPFILQHPYYDLQPWRVPREHGGMESERSYKYQKPGTFNRF